MRAVGAWPPRSGAPLPGAYPWPWAETWGRLPDLRIGVLPRMTAALQRRHEQHRGAVGSVVAVPAASRDDDQVSRTYGAGDLAARLPYRQLTLTGEDVQQLV